MLSHKTVVESIVDLGLIQCSTSIADLKLIFTPISTVQIGADILYYINWYRLIMDRILSIGSELDFADHVDWHEGANYKDNNIMFMNLHDLESQSEKFFHPYFEDYMSVDFPSRKQVRSFVMDGGNDLIVTLPSSPEAEMKGEKQSKGQSQQLPQTGSTNSTDSTDNGLEFFSCDVLRWLPVNVSVEAMSGESVSLPRENKTPNYWDWYFDSDFGWDLTIQNVRQLSSMAERSTYTNPNHPF